MAILDTLQTQYRNIMRVQAIPTADAAALAGLAAQVDAGTLSAGAATAALVHMAINTTSVATLAYNFFTGTTPFQGGLDYLVSPAGPNPNNINSAYYQHFSIENRYINFAVNVGKLGEGAASFAAQYGDLTLAQALVKAYAEIFGSPPDAAGAAGLLNAQVPNGLGGTYTRADYFASYGLDGPNGLGTKAAMVGWLLAEAAKADVGQYAKANDAFLTDLAPDGVANFHTGLLAAYGPPAQPPTPIVFTHDQSVSPNSPSLALQSTAGADVIQGTGGLDAVQSVDGGAGNDTITVAGAVAGLVQGGDGNDLITIDVLNAPVAVLGGGQNGAVLGGAGDDTIVIAQDLKAGAIIDGGAGSDIAMLTLTGPLSGQTKIIGIEGLRLNASADLSGVSGGLSVLQAVGPVLGPGLVFTNVPSGTIIGLRNTGIAAMTASFARGTVFADIHVDGVHGYPAGHVTHVGMSGVLDATNMGVTGVSGTLFFNVESDSEVGNIANLDGNAIVIGGPGALKASVTIGRGVMAASTRLDGSNAGALTLDGYMPQAAANEVVLSAQSDTLSAFLAFQVNTSLTLGAGADTLKLMANSANPLLFSNLAVVNGAAAAYATVTDFAKGVDHIDLGSGVTALTSLTGFVGAATTLEQALVAVSPHLAANATGVFEYAGSTWLYQQDATVGANTGDGLVRLVGVTGLSTATGATVGDIHYG